MIAKRTRLISSKAVHRTRVLAALLLASIAWGATAEFTHSHGFRNQSPRAQTAGNQQFTAEDSVDTSSNTSTSSRSKSADDCLICQLHQNLSQTVLGHASIAAVAETKSFAFSPDLVLHRAGFAKNRRGRAPPVNL